MWSLMHTYFHRNLTVKAQVIAWSLAVGVSVVLVCLVVFVGILLAGSSRVSNGVDEGKAAVGSVLPEVSASSPFPPAPLPWVTPPLL